MRLTRWALLGGLALACVAMASCISTGRLSLAAEQFAATMDRTSLTLESQAIKFRHQVADSTEQIVDGAQETVAVELDNSAQRAVGSLGQSLDNASSDLVEGVQSTLGVELDGTLQRGIADLGSEVRFELGFVRDRLVPDWIEGILSLIRGNRPPSISKVIPDAIDARVAGSRQLTVTLVGYDFDRDSARNPQLRLMLLNETGPPMPVTDHLTIVTSQKAVIPLGPNHLAIGDGARRLYLEWGRKNKRICTIPIVHAREEQVSTQVAQVVPDSIDFRADESRRSKVMFRGKGFEAAGIGADLQLWHLKRQSSSHVSQYLSISSPSAVIASLGSNAIRIAADSVALALRYKGEEISRVPVVNTTERTRTKVTDVPLGAYHWVPPHAPFFQNYYGNRDFDGGGPRAYIHVQMRKRGRSLEVRVFMDAMEWDLGSPGYGRPRHDYSRAMGMSPWQVAYTPPEGTEIVSVLSPTRQTLEYLDSDGALDPFQLPAGELVKQFAGMGDTGGADAGVSTGVTVYFHPAQLKVRIRE